MSFSSNNQLEVKWNTGMMEYWVQKGRKSFFKLVLSFQYSTIPLPFGLSIAHKH
jgi:hypothetical protein